MSHTLYEHTAWIRHPAEIGVQNTVALLPRGTRLGVQVVRKGREVAFKKTTLFCY